MPEEYRASAASSMRENSAARSRAQKGSKDQKSKRKVPVAAPEMIEEVEVELPSRDEIEDLDDNGPALMPDAEPLH